MFLSSLRAIGERRKVKGMAKSAPPPSETSDQFLFRDAFNADVVDYIADGLANARPGVDAETFRQKALAGLSDLTYLDRARHIVAALETVLPNDFPTAARVLISSLGPEPTTEALKGFDGFYVMPLCMYVSRHGMDHPDVSLSTLYEMTKRFTAEGDIRPFIERYPEKTLRFLEELTEDPSPFARRLASEGTRPRLPLAPRLPKFQKDPTRVIRLLDRLYTDGNLMVRRSVANCINDISKDNPEIAVETVARWQAENPGPRTEWIVRHGLRTLIKAGDTAALETLGYRRIDFDVSPLSLSSSVLTLGDSLTFAFEISHDLPEEVRVALNYVIHFVKANGQRRPKVFRMTDKVLEPGIRQPISKTHKFLPYKNQSFYPGEHKIEIVANGMPVASAAFYLSIPEVE